MGSVSQLQQLRTTTYITLKLLLLQIRYKMSVSLFLMLVGVTMAAAAPAPQDERFFGVGGGVPGVIQPGFLGGVQPGFGNPGFANPNFQQIQLNAAGQPCEKFSRNAFGQYVCTETLEQIAPGAFNPSTSGVGQFGGQFGGNPFLQG